MIGRTAILEAFKLALSMVLMYWLALAMDWSMPGNGGLAIILISLGTTGASFQKGLMRIVGTAAGLVVALLALSWFPQERWLTMLFFASYLVVIAYFMQTSRYSYAWFVAGMLPVLVWSSTYMQAGAAFHYATFRYLETTTGVVIYTLVSILFWPIRAGDQLNRQGKELWEGLRQLFAFYRGQLAEGALPAEASGLRAEIAGSLLQMLTTLQTAYSDTPSIVARKGEWEIFRVNVRALCDALALWQDTISDVHELDLERLVPALNPCLDVLDRRLARIAGLWQAKETSEDITVTDDDVLLQPLEQGGTGRQVRIYPLLTVPF